jgi:hypothetical protein
MDSKIEARKNIVSCASIREGNIILVKEDLPVPFQGKIGKTIK